MVHRFYLRIVGHMGGWEIGKVTFITEGKGSWAGRREVRQRSFGTPYYCPFLRPYY
jgi:hypothetical protein